MKTLIICGASVVMAGLIALVIYVSSGQIIDLTAHEVLNVRDKPPINGSKIVGQIKAGQTVAVLGCEVEKDSFSPRIRLVGGVEGYVLEGKFKFDRRTVSLAEFERIVHGCG